MRVRRVLLLAGHTSHSFVTLAIRRAASWRLRVFIPYVRCIPAPFRGVTSSTPFQYGYLGHLSTWRRRRAFFRRGLECSDATRPGSTTFPRSYHKRLIPRGLLSFHVVHRLVRCDNHRPRAMVRGHAAAATWRAQDTQTPSSLRQPPAESHGTRTRCGGNMAC